MSGTGICHLGRMTAVLVIEIVVFNEIALPSKIKIRFCMYVSLQNFKRSLFKSVLYFSSLLKS